MKKDRNDYRAMRDGDLIREMKDGLDAHTDYKELAIVLAERLKEKGEYR